MFSGIAGWLLVYVSSSSQQSDRIAAPCWTGAQPHSDFGDQQRSGEHYGRGRRPHYIRLARKTDAPIGRDPIHVPEAAA